VRGFTLIELEVVGTGNTDCRQNKYGFGIFYNFDVDVTSRHGADKTEEMGTETGKERNGQN